ncbi:MAG: glycosyltransferase [Bacteroidales bacterium]|jgi:glycosyltransferase involved in cell wall biosynthesis|nr:glycosyltransferase [Bacteroidales bacterium]
MKSNPKHILFLPRWYPNQFDPMFGLFVKKQAESVAIYNMVSVLYVQGISTEEELAQKQSIEAPNLFTYIYYYNNSSLRAWNILRFWYYMLIGFISIWKKHKKPDLVHVHILTRLGTFAFFLKAIFNIPYIITEHWSRYLTIPGTYKGWLRKKLGQIVAHRAKAILPVSINLAVAMQKHGLLNSNYHIIPNVVDDLFFQNIQKKKSKESTIFIHVSTFEDRSKNISGILRTLKRLSERQTDFEFWFIGEGIDFDFLTEYSKKLNILQELIKFHGLKQGQGLVDLYYSADYLVLFSNFENIPVVINEAQACGLPVIASKVGGIPEIINRENGFLIEPGKEDQLESTIEYILTNKPSFNASEIQKNALARYSYKTVGQQITSIYRAP